MSYQLHPEAAKEHGEQVAYYEGKSKGLGGRYHAAFKTAATKVSQSPQAYRVYSTPDLRRISFNGFPHHLIFRVSASGIQILAVAHNRRRPGYWTNRLK